MRKLLPLLFIFIVPAKLRAQIFPAEGSKLNYRFAGISYPAKAEVSKYKIEIAAGNYNTDDSFSSHVIQALTVKGNKIIAEVPSFGAAYTWRVTAHGDKGPAKNVFHHFSTLTIPAVDTAHTRLRVIKQAEKHKDDYIFLDGNRALYDMNGQPVWYLPDVDKRNAEKSLMRDLKLSPQGTITFMYEEQGAYEINFNGDILWKAPNNGKVSGGSTETYHHGADEDAQRQLYGTGNRK
jgi:hypothetical protein